MSSFLKRRLCLIPLDSRPVCYEQPLWLGRIAGLDLSMPPAKQLGFLKEPGDQVALERWVKKNMASEADMIVALDTVAYGGLIPSRSGDESLEEIEERLNTFFGMTRSSNIYGFSSIMRIPDSDVADEEPDYWKPYGKKLYQYSVETHRDASASAEIRAQLPQNILDDFIERRQRNFEINQSYMDWVQKGRLSELTYCQDDTGAFGLNVQEANRLREQIQTEGLGQRCHIKTGADEVASSLMARWMLLVSEKTLRICPLYSSESGALLIARFDGIPVKQVVNQHLESLGAVCVDSPDDADLLFVVHTPGEEQGDHCIRHSATVFSEQYTWVLDVLDKAKNNGQPVVLADVAYANGSDPHLSESLLSKFKQLDFLYGYAGWNTPGNTIGSALSMGVIRLLAEQAGTYNAEAFSKLLLIRFGDDWLYQADIRYNIRDTLPEHEVLMQWMASGLELLKARLQLPSVHFDCQFPCHRKFEIDLGVRQ